MQKIVNPAFKKPVERNPTPLQQPEYFKRELKSWESIHLSYESTSELQKKERHWLLRADHPEHLHTTLCRVYRVKIRPGMFEDAEGNVVPADQAPSQAIVYSLSEYVDSPEYIKSGGQSGVEKISGDFYSEGRYIKHIGKFDFDDRGNIINSKHIGTRFMYYIPYSPKAIRDILKKYDHDRTLSFACCVANEGGSEPYVGTPKTVHNLEEFCDIEDIDGLMKANIGIATAMGSKVGSFLDERKGGYQRWKSYQDKVDKEIQETEISALDKAEQTTTKQKRREYKPPE